MPGESKCPLMRRGNTTLSTMATAQVRGRQWQQPIEVAVDHTFNPGRIRIPTGSDLGMAKEEMCNKLGLGCFSVLLDCFSPLGSKAWETWELLPV